jgi:hypothetical protein
MPKHFVVAGKVAGIRHVYSCINLRLVDFSISFHDFAFSGLWKWLRPALIYCIFDNADGHLHGSDQLRYNFCAG